MIFYGFQELFTFSISHAFIFFFSFILHTHTQIRIHIKQSESRQITVCLRFPASDYPSGSILLIELKSVTISGKLLAALTTKAEQKAREFLGKPQVRNCYSIDLLFCFVNVFDCLLCVCVCMYKLGSPFHLPREGHR